MRRTHWLEFQGKGFVKAWFVRRENRETANGRCARVSSGQPISSERLTSQAALARKGRSIAVGGSRRPQVRFRPWFVKCGGNKEGQSLQIYLKSPQSTPKLDLQLTKAFNRVAWRPLPYTKTTPNL